MVVHGIFELFVFFLELDILNVNPTWYLAYAIEERSAEIIQSGPVTVQ